MRRLYSHQLRALRELPKRGGYLAFEMGLGKTFTAIEYAYKHGHSRVLVICPAVALGVWADELKQEEEPYYLPTGSRKEKAIQVTDAERGYMLLNYEAIIETAVERAINKWNPTLIIVDEAHKIKSATAKRSKVVHRLTKEREALLLSGTPIANNLLDLYSQYKAIDPLIWGGISWTKFKNQYGIWGGYQNYQLIGIRGADELLKIIEPWTVVARKEDVLDLPDKLFTRVPVPFEHGFNEYRRMAATGVNSEHVTHNPLEKSLRLHQLAGRAKIDATVQLVESLVEQGEQVAVYAMYRDELEQLSKRLKVESLTGDTSADRRSAMTQEFQQGKEKIFLSQIVAGSTAITLTAASHMVYHSTSWSYVDFAQSQDRIHRIGTKNIVNYYLMVARGPKGGKLIDEKILKALENKQDFADEVMKNPDLLLEDDDG